MVFFAYLASELDRSQSVRTVTVTKTIAPGQPSSSSRPANKPSSSPPAVTSRPGNVNLGNGGSVVKNTKTSSDVKNTKTSSNVENTKASSLVKNTKTSSILSNTITSSSVKNTQTPGVKGDTNIKDGNNGNPKNTNTKNVNTKTSSVVSSSTGMISSTLHFSFR